MVKLGAVHGAGNELAVEFDVTTGQALSGPACFISKSTCSRYVPSLERKALIARIRWSVRAESIRTYETKIEAG